MDVVFEKIKALIEKINEKNPYYLVIAVLILLLIVFYLFPLQFQLASLQKLNPRIKTLTQDVENTKNNILRVQQYKTELKKIQDKLDKLNRRIKTKEEIPFLLGEISLLAGNNGVKIEQIMPQAAFDEPMLETEEGKYFSVPIMVEAQCGYHDFGKFLNQLEREGVFLKLPSFTIVGGQEDPRMAQVRLSLELVVFQKK